MKLSSPSSCAESELRRSIFDCDMSSSFCWRSRMGVLHAHSLSQALHQYRRPSSMAQAILNRAVSGDWTKILFDPDSGEIFSNVVTQPRKRNRDAASLEGPRQPAQHASRGDVD